MIAGSVHDDLRRLRFPVAVVLVLIALAVLALRAVGLAVALVVTAAERLDTLAAVAAGIAPLAASTWLLSTTIPTGPGGDLS